MNIPGRFAVVLATCVAMSSLNAEIGPIRPFPMAEPGLPTDARNHLPVLTTSVDAQYPDAETQALEDEVWVAFIVEKDGKTGAVRAFFGRHPALEAAAVDAVKQWTFEPGVHEGRIVRTRMVVPIRFARADANRPTAQP